MRLTTLSPIGDLLLDAHAFVGEGLKVRGSDPLYVLGATLEGRPVGLVGDIAVEDLVHQVQVTLVRDLLDVTPDDGLVLFFGRHDAPPYREALPLGWDAAPLMLPAQEAWRIL
jgi:hypothetical protein